MNSLCSPENRLDSIFGRSAHENVERRALHLSLTHGELRAAVETGHDGADRIPLPLEVELCVEAAFQKIRDGHVGQELAGVEFRNLDLGVKCRRRGRRVQAQGALDIPPGDVRLQRRDPQITAFQVKTDFNILRLHRGNKRLDGNLQNRLDGLQTFQRQRIVREDTAITLGFPPLLRRLAGDEEIGHVQPARFKRAVDRRDRRPQIGGDRTGQIAAADFRPEFRKCQFRRGIAFEPARDRVGAKSGY